jgi:hypothetical protein
MGMWWPCTSIRQKNKYILGWGDANLDLTVYASKRPLHSGHYGNWAPNPAMMLAELLASMKDSNGRDCKRIYDDVIPLSSSESGFIRSSFCWWTNENRTRNG